MNPYEGMEISVPPSGARLKFSNPESIFEYEKLGIPELKNTCFVLVAGGLGERLGYSSIKIGIPLDLVTQTTFLQYYCENILAIQHKYGTLHQSHLQPRAPSSPSRL